MKDLSSRTRGIAPSMTVAIDTLAKNLIAEGRDVVSLGAGEPDFDTPAPIQEAAIAAIRAGKTRYTSPDGILSVKQAICRKLERENGLCYTPAQIIITSGAKHAVFNSLLALIDDGDEVLIPAPYWVTYPELVKLLGGVPVFLPSDESTGFRVTAAQLEEAITPRTKCVILNNPCNPTGVVYTPAELAAFAEVMIRHDLYCLSDEIYEHLVYEGEFASMAAQTGMQERTLIVNGLSKAYCMTGWRVGYVAAPVAIAKEIAKAQGQTTHHPSNIAQYGAQAALDGDFATVIQMRAAFQERRDWFLSALRALPGLRIPKPAGAFYIFADIQALYGKKTPAGEAITGSVDFCRYLLDSQGLAIVPGAAFGLDSCIRFSYAASLTTLRDAYARFERAVNALQ
jgi:aspartate aminotransferase